MKITESIEVKPIEDQKTLHSMIKELKKRLFDSLFEWKPSEKLGLLQICVVASSFL